MNIGYQTPRGGKLCVRYPLALLAAAMCLTLPLAAAEKGDLSDQSDASDKSNPPAEKVLPPAKPSRTVTLRAGGAPEDGPLRLVGPNRSAQVVALSEKGEDLTRDLRYSLEPEGIAAIDATGHLVPEANGRATLTATLPGDKVPAASLPVVVERFGDPPPVSFPNDVVPVFTRNGCNAGACHAKETGQNGFQLSLLGYEPEADYQQITLHSRGRRISTAAPANSLLLLKATGTLPHQGGARLDADSADYRTILRWVESGAALRPEDDPVVESIAIFPSDAVLAPGDEQQLAVTARFSDGTSRDITRIAQYEANHPDMAEPDETGLVRIGKKPGRTAVLVRFQEHIDTFTATIPLGGESPELPEPENFIDRHLFDQLSLLGLPPSGPADDSTFLRRVTLDIAGRLPTLEETETFLASDDPAKRRAKIDELLDSPGYADLFAGKWGAILRNKADRGRPWVIRDTHAFHAWIRTSLLRNKPYDQFASELILASGKVIDNPAVAWYHHVEDQKERMENVAQIFLGLRMQCAQCHHHPFDRWSQDDYYSLTAFFSTVKQKEIRKRPEENILHHQRVPARMKHPGTGEMLSPHLPGEESSLEIPAEQDPRTELAAWMRSPDNPWFARMLVNRYWKHFFNRGLVEPEDDLRPSNPATHPALLDELAASFVESGYDLKELIRNLCNSRAYQFRADPVEGNAGDEQNYARHYPERLPAEVLLDSINEVTGSSNRFANQPVGVRAVALPNEKGTVESAFLRSFGRPANDTACECERSGEANLGQSLQMINSDTIQEKIASDQGLAARLAKDGDRSAAERIDELYLRALSRKPRAEEREFALAHLKKKRAAAGGNVDGPAAPDQDKGEGKAAAKPSAASKPDPAKREAATREAFEDIVWAMLNTKEFLFSR